MSESDSSSSRTTQQTFGRVVVNEYNRDSRTCDKVVGVKDNGQVNRCSNTASYTILTDKGVAEFYCEMHTKNTWKEMANEVLD